MIKKVITNNFLYCLIFACTLLTAFNCEKTFAYDFTQNRPSITNDSGRNIESAHPIGRRSYRLGIDYSQAPTQQIVNGPENTKMLNLKGAYGVGINDTLTIGINAYSADEVAQGTADQGLGDLEVGYFHRINNRNLRNSFSFGLIASVPTSDNPDYFGGSHANFRIPLLYTHNTYSKIFNLQLTPIYRQSGLIGENPISSGLGWGAGATLNIWPKFNVFAEINGEYGLKKNAVNNYGEFTLGLSTQSLNSSWFIKAGFSQDMYRSNINKQTKVFISLNFNFNKVKSINKKNLALDCLPPEPENIVVDWPELPKKIFVLNFDKVHFDTDKHNIKPEYYSTLDKVITILENHPEIKKLSITGHTDLRMTYDYNVALSQRRSNSVYEYLINSGIDPDRLDTEHMSYIHPNDDEITTEGLAANRRVEFQVIKLSDKGLIIDRSYRTKRDYGKEK